MTYTLSVGNKGDIMKPRPNNKPHPLEDVVLRAFAKSDHQDASSLGYFLAGAILRGGGNKSYHTVAKDVLGYMEGQGKLRRDEVGWYYLDTKSVEPTAATAAPR